LPQAAGPWPGRAPRRRGVACRRGGADRHARAGAGRGGYRRRSGQALAMTLGPVDRPHWWRAAATGPGRC